MVPILSIPSTHWHRTSLWVEDGGCAWRGQEGKLSCGIQKIKGGEGWHGWSFILHLTSRCSSWIRRRCAWSRSSCSIARHRYPCRSIEWSVFVGGGEFKAIVIHCICSNCQCNFLCPECKHHMRHASMVHLSQRAQGTANNKWSQVLTFTLTVQV